MELLPEWQSTNDSSRWKECPEQDTRQVVLSKRWCFFTLLESTVIFQKYYKPLVWYRLLFTTGVSCSRFDKWFSAVLAPLGSKCFPRHLEGESRLILLYIESVSVCPQRGNVLLAASIVPRIPYFSLVLHSFCVRKYFIAISLTQKMFPYPWIHSSPHCCWCIIKLGKREQTKWHMVHCIKMWC